jgi:hypothetical protein
VTVLGHARSHLNGQIQKKLNIGMHKRPQKSAPVRFGGNAIMAELVNGAIHVTIQKDYKGPFQGFKINPKRTLKKMFNRFKAEYDQSDKFYNFLSQFQDPGNETGDQIGMDEGAHIECFNFLNFFSRGDLAETDGHHISVHLQ